jgi:Glycosyl transferase family 11
MERSFNYDDRILGVGSGSTVLGWFQSWKYFPDVADEIRWRVLAISKPSQWYLSMKKRIRPGTGSVVLNVRRGDYLTGRNYKHFGIASASYYQRALELIQRLGLDGPIYVASDSIDVAMKELASIDHLLPLVPPPDVNPLEVLLLLSRSDAFVAANSTFSWWAAFLGEKPEQIVIAPRPWFSSSGIDTRDLLPPNWLTLDREVASGLDRSDPDRSRDSGCLS